MDEIEWRLYDWNYKNTHPPVAGRYLVYRKGCDKMHFQQWNGSGWASDNDITHWTIIPRPYK